MISIRINFYLLLLFFVVYTINCSIVFAESATFIFNPADGLRIIQTSNSDIELYVDGEKKINDTSVSKTEIVFHSTANGYTITNTLKSIEAARNGKKVSSPVNDILIGREVSLIVDKDGKLANIKGYESLLDEIKKVVPAKMHDLFTKLLDEDIMKKKASAEWNGRIADFSGKTVKDGEKWASVSEYIIKDQTIKYLITTKFSEVTDSSIRIDFDYTSDKDSIAKLLNELNKDIVKNIKVADFSAGNSLITGSGYRITDPNTMIINEEQIQRTIETRLRTKDGSEHMTKRIEKREFKFDVVE